MQEKIVWNKVKNNTDESTVQFGEDVDDLSRKATGSRTKFVDGGAEHHMQYIHRVKLTNLTTGNTYSKYF